MSLFIITNCVAPRELRFTRQRNPFSVFFPLALLLLPSSAIAYNDNSNTDWPSVLQEHCFGVQGQPQLAHHLYD